ncbi:hypothetical protein [Microbacterium paraoxydans]|uniref:hypothetical protein n=1 Tax=Microbacterium paraoxydans TaxID=199592 RepID=UPI003D75DBCD
MNNLLGVGAVAETAAVETSVSFDEWTGGRDLASIGTNSGSRLIAFQTWKHFKEAFAPELIREAIAASPVPVRGLLDPFGGSGTTALASQFLGVHPTTVEVNPFLADLIKSKLHPYDLGTLLREVGQLSNRLSGQPPRMKERYRPATFVEPGVRGRYLFSETVALAVDRILDAIDECADDASARLFKIALSGVLLDFCNARVSGKGRRYRSNWQTRELPVPGIRDAFITHVQEMVGDVAKFANRTCTTYDVILGDSREVALPGRSVDMVLFSPPYPNSFDYTDVYNIELWMLGYLGAWADNRDLRGQTLSSHVQVSRDFSTAPSGSPLLFETVAAMEQARDELWDRRLPDMVGGYFSDLWRVILNSTAPLTSGGQIWMVVGDSRYSTVTIRVADIIAELAQSEGLKVVEKRPFRSMRASPQQGGRAELAETLLILAKP